MTAVAAPESARIEAGSGPSGAHAARAGSLYLFLTAIAVLLLFPILYAIYTSLRPYSDTADARLRVDRALAHL